MEIPNELIGLGRTRHVCLSSKTKRRNINSSPLLLSALQNFDEKLPESTPFIFSRIQAFFENNNISNEERIQLIKQNEGAFAKFLLNFDAASRRVSAKSLITTIARVYPYLNVKYLTKQGILKLQTLTKSFLKDWTDKICGLIFACPLLQLTLMNETTAEQQDLKNTLEVELVKLNALDRAVAFFQACINLPVHKRASPKIQALIQTLSIQRPPSFGVQEHLVWFKIHLFIEHADDTESNIPAGIQRIILLLNEPECSPACWRSFGNGTVGAVSNAANWYMVQCFRRILMQFKELPLDDILIFSIKHNLPPLLTTTLLVARLSEADKNGLLACKLELLLDYLKRYKQAPNSVANTHQLVVSFVKQLILLQPLFPSSISIGVDRMLRSGMNTAQQEALACEMALNFVPEKGVFMTTLTALKTWLTTYGKNSFSYQGKAELLQVLQELLVTTTLKSSNSLEIKLLLLQQRKQHADLVIVLL